MLLWAHNRWCSYILICVYQCINLLFPKCAVVGYLYVNHNANNLYVGKNWHPSLFKINFPGKKTKNDEWQTFALKRKSLFILEIFFWFLSLPHLSSVGSLSMLYTLILLCMGCHLHDFLRPALLTLILLWFSMLALSKSHLWCPQFIVLLTGTNEPLLISHYLLFSFFF